MAEDTKFPFTVLEMAEYIGFDYLAKIHISKLDGADAYAKDAVDDWFQRCREDFPEYAPNIRCIVGEAGANRQKEVWFKKWFGQFNEELVKEYEEYINTQIYARNPELLQFPKEPKTKKRLLNLLDPITGIDRQIVVELPDELHGSKVMDYFVSLLEGKPKFPKYISVEEF